MDKKTIMGIDYARLSLIYIYIYIYNQEYVGLGLCFIWVISNQRFKGGGGVGYEMWVLGLDGSCNGRFQSVWW